MSGAPPGMSMSMSTHSRPPPSNVLSGAPGTAPPPGMQQANLPPSNRPTGLPASFQGLVNMPNINFSAPVIRLGTTAPTKPILPLGGPNRVEMGPRPGLGVERSMDQQRQTMKENIMNLIPPTKEEIVRTIFVGGITEGCGGDEGMERLLSTAGRLRRWDRAMDATGKPCSFGFAQFDDAESLSTAIEVLKDIEVPVRKQTPADTATKMEDKEEEEVEKSKLLIFVDDNSLNYLEKYGNSDNDPAAAQTRLDAAKSGLKSALHDLFHPPLYFKSEDNDGDAIMRDGEGGDNVEVINIPLAADDELADIPAEMRETVALEIASFRDRSIQRDMERLKREEEMEAAERARNGARRLSPGPSNGVNGTNNIPLGPRGLNAPSGPKAQGVQIPRDYQQGVSFVNGSGTNGNASGNVYIDRADEDSEASDDELERRRIAKRDVELEKQFLDQERRWLNRERSRTAAVEREKDRDAEEDALLSKEKERMGSWLRDFSDEAEAQKKSIDYYKDRSLWFRNRAAFRAREALDDDRDRAEEERTKERVEDNKKRAQGAADNFLDRQAEEMSRLPQQAFKISLGAAAQKAQRPVITRRTVAEVEGLLEDEEEDANAPKRTLIPIKFDPSARADELTPEEREEANKRLAQEIPSTKEGLWAWNVQWDFVDDAVVSEKLRPFVEKKIVEYLGVQEQLLVEVVEEHLRKRGKPQELVEELEGVSFLIVCC